MWYLLHTVPSKYRKGNGKPWIMVHWYGDGCIFCAVDLMKPEATVILRNAKIDMFKGSMRLAVDKWGRIEVTEPATFVVKEDNNLSLVEYELVNVVEEWLSWNQPYGINYKKECLCSLEARYPFSRGMGVTFSLRWVCYTNLTKSMSVFYLFTVLTSTRFGAMIFERSSV